MAANIKNLTDLLVTDYIGFNGGSLVVMADGSNLNIGRSIVDSANVVSGDMKNSVELINLDDWRKGAPLKELPPDLKQKLADCLCGPDEYHNTLLYITQSLEGEAPMRAALAEFAGARGKIGGLPNCTVDVLEAGFSTFNKPGFSSELYDFIKTVTEVELTCDRGSKVTLTLDHVAFDVVNSNGKLIPGKYANPIPAEVYAHPASVDGTLVISGSYGPLMGYKPFVGNFRALMGVLNKTPITWKIKSGKITEVTCENRDVETFVRKEVFETDAEHGMKIGEFGLPANLYVLGREITGNLMIDEKGRVHLANGHGYQKRTRCEYDTRVHGDGLVACASLRANNLGKQFMEKNRYSKEIFRTLQKQK